MKNEQSKKLVVQMTMSKEDVVGYGYNQALKRSWKKAMVRFLVLLAGVMAATYFNVTWLSMVLAIGMFAYLLAWMMKCQIAGKKLWVSVQGKPEPIML